MCKILKSFSSCNHQIDHINSLQSLPIPYSLKKDVAKIALPFDIYDIDDIYDIYDIYLKYVKFTYFYIKLFWS